MHECMALFTWTHVYFYLFVFSLPCFYACSFAGYVSDSQKCWISLREGG